MLSMAWIAHEGDGLGGTCARFVPRIGVVAEDGRALVGAPIER